MISRWYEYKSQAMSMRINGTSMTVIEKELGIPRSTLSDWFRNIKLTDEQKNKLKANTSNALAKARVNAVAWHNKQKEIRIQIAENQAFFSLSKIDIKNKYIIELALSLLYLGEGSKDGRTLMGNSNPLILRFFIKCLDIIYGIKPSVLKCNLHLRDDQDSEKLKRYWSKQLGIPLNNFGASIKDKRTINKKTYSNYKGVCVVSGGGVNIQRRLVFLSEAFCDKIVRADD